MGGRGKLGAGSKSQSGISTSEQLELMESYVGPEGYDMNSWLRGTFDEDTSESDMTENEIAEITTRFAKVLDSQSLSKDEQVYRGATFDTIIESTGLTKKQILSNPSVLVGKTITEKGFMSTTKTKSMAEEYAQGNVLFQIKLPKGAKAIHQNELLPYLSGDEITVQRNAQLKIDSVRISKGTVNIQATYTGRKRGK